MSFTIDLGDNLVGSVRIRLPDPSPKAFFEFARRNVGVKTEMLANGDPVMPGLRLATSWIL